MEKFAVGVDFGGTKISAGVVNLESGRLVGTAKKKTRQVQEQDDVIRRIITVVDEAISESGVEMKKIAGIGIGAAGMVNREKGILLAAVNIGANDVPLAEPLSKHYGLPCKLGNDVEVATIGEMAFGAGRDCKNFVCIFVGTGIGSGIVQNGTLVRGATGTAGEVGHITLYPDGKLCGCGAYGCLEAYASRTAVAKDILADLQRGHDSVIREKVDMTKGILRSKAIAQAVASGDEMVTGAVEQAARCMATGLVTVINFLNPQRIILGGGLVEAVNLYFDTAELYARRRCLKIPGRKIEIVRAELGDYAGIVGAAMLSRNGSSK
ncbi:MAG: ROK family protein [Candidatus Melainabacteria bacterium]|nr:MAG: ROK family protein [Candidatus Melainabacteria bacterium]